MRRQARHDDKIEQREAFRSVMVAEVMRRDHVSVTETTREDELMALLLEHGLHGVPVVDSNGMLVGFVTLTDIVRERFENGDTRSLAPLRVPTRTGVTYGLGAGFHEESVPAAVSEIMSTVAVEILETASLDTAASLMAAREVSQVPVVNDEGQVVGMLYAYDVLRWVSDHNGRRRTAPVGEVH